MLPKNIQILDAAIKAKKKLLKVSHAHHNIFDTNKDTKLIFAEIDCFIQDHK